MQQQCRDTRHQVSAALILLSNPCNSNAETPQHEVSAALILLSNPCNSNAETRGIRSVRFSQKIRISLNKKMGYPAVGEARRDTMLPRIENCNFVGNENGNENKIWNLRMFPRKQG